MSAYNIESGDTVIDTQIASAFESGSGLRDAFSKIMDAPPSFQEQSHILKASSIDTPLGPMIAIADEKGLFLLDFIDRRGIAQKLARLRQKTKSAIIPGSTHPIDFIQKELRLYFSGTLKQCKTPLHLTGTPFQKSVWNALCAIPYGHTQSYAELAAAIGNQSAYRAVANANAANQIAIAIPCHRVINSNGETGGYGGGIKRKEYLLNLEKKT